MDQIILVSDKLIKDTFYRWAEKNGTTDVTVSFLASS